MTDAGRIEGCCGCVLLLMGLWCYVAILWARFRSSRKRTAYADLRDYRPAYMFSGALMLQGMWPVERYFMPDCVWHAVPIWWHLLTQTGFIAALVGVALVYETCRLRYVKGLDLHGRSGIDAGIER